MCVAATTRPGREWSHQAGTAESEREGASKRGDPSSGRGRRKVYVLTCRGRRSGRAWEAAEAGGGEVVASCAAGRGGLGVLLPAQPARATEVCREEGGGRLWRRDEEVLAEEGEVRMLLSRLLSGPADHASGLDAARRLRAGGAVEKVALRKHRENDALELERLLVRGGDRRDGARQCVKSREGPSVEDSGDVLPQRVLRNRMMRGAGGDCADATHRAGSG